MFIEVKMMMDCGYSCLAVWAFTESNLLELIFLALCFLLQRDCIQFALTAKPTQRYMPADHKSLQYKIWTLVMSKRFDAVILVLIALNTGVLITQVKRMLKASNFLVDQKWNGLEHRSSFLQQRSAFCFLGAQSVSFCFFLLPSLSHCYNIFIICSIISSLNIFKILSCTSTLVLLSSTWSRPD